MGWSGGSADDLVEEAASGPMSFRCIVKLTVWYLKDGTTPADISYTQQLHCETEMGTITYDTEDSATVDMDDWFILGISKLRATIESDDGKPEFRVADRYRYELAISAVDHASTWPPLHTGDPGFGRNAKNVEVVVWFETHRLKPPSNTPPTRVFFRSAGVVGKNSAHLSVVIETGWRNPRKRLLLRQQKPKRQATPGSDGRALEAASSFNTILTCYTFVAEVRNGRSTFGPPDSKGQHTFTTPGFGCCLCDGRQFPSVKYLHFHFVTAHALFHFKVTSRKPQPGLRSGDQYADLYIKVVVDLARDTTHSRASDHTPDHRTMTWVRPTREFDVNRILKGDWSWMNERKGTVAANRPVAGPEFPEPAGMKRHFDWNDIRDVTQREKRRFLVKKPRHTEKGLVYVRTVSKRYVEVGEVLSDSDDDVDEEWLFRKHEEVCTNLVVGVVFWRRFLSNGSGRVLANLKFSEVVRWTAGL